MNEKQRIKMLLNPTIVLLFFLRVPTEIEYNIIMIWLPLVAQSTLISSLLLLPIPLLLGSKGASSVTVRILCWVLLTLWYVWMIILSVFQQTLTYMLFSIMVFLGWYLMDLVDKHC